MSALPDLGMATPRTGKDPVCGMDVDLADPKGGSLVHQGTTYGFCSKHCLERFRADPARFLGVGHVPSMTGEAAGTAAPQGPANYTPLAVVIGLILVVTAVLAYRDLRRGEWGPTRSIGHFMAGFFLVFAGFKLVDLRGFADAYSTYDLLAKRVPAYGYLYPFLELGFGLAMLVVPDARPLLVAEVALMAFSGLGVAVKLARHERFQCACLGTFLKVPLTKVTLVEDFGMAALALAMIAL